MAKIWGDYASLLEAVSHITSDLKPVIGGLLSSSTLQEDMLRIFQESQASLARLDVQRMKRESAELILSFMDDFDRHFAGLPVQRLFSTSSRFVPALRVMIRLLYTGLSAYASASQMTDE